MEETLRREIRLSIYEHIMVWKTDPFDIKKMIKTHNFYTKKCDELRKLRKGLNRN